MVTGTGHSKGTGLRRGRELRRVGTVYLHGAVLAARLLVRAESDRGAGLAAAARPVPGRNREELPSSPDAPGAGDRF